MLGFVLDLIVCCGFCVFVLVCFLCLYVGSCNKVCFDLRLLLVYFALIGLGLFDIWLMFGDLLLEVMWVLVLCACGGFVLW